MGESDSYLARQSIFFGNEYFSKWVHFKEEIALPKMIAVLAKPAINPKANANFLFKIFLLRLELAIERYSRGEATDEIKRSYLSLVEALESARREQRCACTEEEICSQNRFRDNIDIYVISLWLISLGVCLEVDAQMFKRVLDLIGNEGEDWLFEQLVSSRVQGRKQTSTVLFPGTYNLLKFAIQESRLAERNRLLRGFIQKWYPSLSKTYWHDSHEGPDGGGYFGYWCFELAAAVKVFKLDDSAIIDSPYYPKDLIR